MRLLVDNYPSKTIRDSLGNDGKLIMGMTFTKGGCEVDQGEGEEEGVEEEGDVGGVQIGDGRRVVRMDVGVDLEEEMGGKMETDPKPL